MSKFYFLCFLLLQLKPAENLDKFLEIDLIDNFKVGLIPTLENTQNINEIDEYYFSTYRAHSNLEVTKEEYTNAYKEIEDEYNFPDMIVGKKEVEDQKDLPTTEDTLESRNVCSLCQSAPKKFPKHLFEVHFICMCSKEHSNASSAKQCHNSHQRIRHSEHWKKYTKNKIFLKLYSCNQCENKFSQAGMIKHKTYKHFTCPTCNKKFDNRLEASRCHKNH